MKPSHATTARKSSRAKMPSYKLSQAENHMLNLLASMNLSVIILDRDLRIRRFTPTAQKVLNLAYGDVGRLLSEVRMPLSLPDLEQQIRETIETLKPFQSDVLDETGCPYTLQVRPYATGDKRLEGAVVVLADISAEEKRFRVIADLLPEAIAYVGPDGRYVFANTAFLGRYGLSQEQVRGRSVREVIGEEIYESVRPAFDRVMSGKRAEYEGYFKFPKGSGRCVHIDYLPRRDANNRTIGYYFVLRDLAVLKEDEEKFQRFVENAPLTMIIHNADGTMVDVRGRLTKREAEIMKLVAAGKSNKEIGALLDVTEGTVKVHVGHVFKKLRAGGRTDAVRIALERGIVHLPSL